LGLRELSENGVNILLDNNPCVDQITDKEEPICELRLIGPRFDVGWSEMVGRRPTQEDAFCICGPIGDIADDITLFGLFDGHAGKFAASFAATNFPKHLELKLPFVDRTDAPLKALEESFHSVNEALRLEIKNHSGSLRHCGSTGVVVLFVGDSVFVSNVGDSRAVMFNGGKNLQEDHRSFGSCSVESVLRLSEDHKPELEVPRIHAAGGYVIDHRVNGILAVSRSIGDFYMQRWVLCSPSSFKYTLPPHEDTLISICCDGVWDELSDHQACNIALMQKDLHKASTILRDYAYFLGSADNISVMLIKVKQKHQMM